MKQKQRGGFLGLLPMLMMQKGGNKSIRKINKKSRLSGKRQKQISVGKNKTKVVILDF